MVFDAIFQNSFMIAGSSVLCVGFDNDLSSFGIRWLLPLVLILKVQLSPHKLQWNLPLNQSRTSLTIIMKNSTNKTVYKK